MNLLPRLTLLGMAALAVPAVSFGQVVPGSTTVNLVLSGVDPSNTGVNGHAGNGNFSNVAAGIYNFTGSATTPPPPSLDGPLALFCIELSELAPKGVAQTYNVVLPQFGSANSASPLGDNIGATGIGLNRALNLQLLYGNVFGSVSGYTAGLTSFTSTQKSAFQIAVWELSHDDDFDVDSGTGLGFWITNPSSSHAIVTQAQTWVNGVKTDRLNNDLTGQVTLVALHNATYQDQILPHASGSVIPEPSTWAALIGLAALGFVAVRRFRRNAA